MDILVVSLSNILISIINLIDSLDITVLIFVIIGLIAVIVVGMNNLDSMSDEEEISPFRMGCKLPSVLTSLGLILFPVLYGINAISLSLASIMTVVSLVAFILNIVLRIIEYGGRGIVACVLFFCISLSLFLISSMIIPLILPGLDAMRFIFSAIIVIILLCVIMFKTKLERWSAY